MKLAHIQNVYLVGIGGIGMSGLARYFKNRGCEVAGYDKTETILTNELVSEGIPVSYIDDASFIPETFLVHDPSTLIIYTPAIPQDSEILNYFIEQDFILRKRAQVLGIISESSFTIGVAGTHGKTTTSTIIAHLLKHSGYDCSAFLGGISTNYQSNILFGKNNVMVVEADEFDRSFLTLHPDIAIVTSMDADHLDIYGDKNHIEESFRLYASQVKRGGKLIFKYNLPIQKNGITYGVNSTSADYTAHNIRIQNGKYVFDFKNGSVEFKDMSLGLPGLHNVENATAAIIVGLLLQIPEEKIRAALATFAGVKRRFEYIVQNEKMVYIDDYAHHPEELKACINSVRQMYPTKKLTVIFQPHLFSRTKDFAQEFSEVLSLADQLIVMDIYPARELPIAGVDANLILNQVSIANKQLASKENLMEKLANMDIELLLTVGAGDIDTMVKPIQELVG
jgi:UDP-N-acetylmuramate--alanine ligase